MSAIDRTPPPGVIVRRIATEWADIAAWDRPGTGAPILLLHGNSASKAAFARLMAEPALDGRRLVAIDLPGCGESGDARDPAVCYTIPGLARAIADVSAKLSLDAPVVLGWSLGGHVAIEAAGQGMPMCAMVLTGTPPCGPGADELAESFRETDVMAVTFMESPPADALRAYVQALYGDEQVPDALLADASRADGRLRALFSAHWLQGGEGFHQRSVIAGSDRPIAVLQGGDDPFIHVDILRRLDWGRLWRNDVQILPGGHAPFFETPALFARELRAFIDHVAG